MTTNGPTTADPLVYYTGDTILMDVTCVDGSGNVIDLTGAGLEWMLEDPAGMLATTLSLGNGIEIGAEGSQAGEIQVTCPTAGFLPGWYRYQLRLETSAGLRFTQMVGLIKLNRSLGDTVTWQVSARIGIGSGLVAVT